MFDKGERIGSGNEKDVYQNADNPDNVIAVFKEGMAEGTKQARGAFYLQKIIKCLFPDNFPDIHLACHNDGETLFVLEKIETDAGHKAFHKSLSANRLTPEEQQSQKEYIRRVNADPNRKVLNGKLAQAGIIVDKTFFNYAYDPKQNLVNLDSRLPWTNREEELYRLRYEPNKLERAIKNITDEKTRKQAEKHFKRLEELRMEEEDEMGLPRTI